jgi:plastocyanin
MNIAHSFSRLFARQQTSIFSNVTVGSLLASAVFLSSIKLIVGRVGGPPWPIAVSMLAGAIILATNIRWISILGIVLTTGYLIAFAFQAFVPYHLTQPKIQFETFLAILLLIVVLGIGLVASIAWFVEHIRQRVKPSPRWLQSLIMLACGLVLGAVLIASISQSPTTASAFTQTTYTNGVPTVHMGIDNFDQSSVTIPKGSKLLLVDDSSSYEHVLSNGTWQNGQPQPETAPGAPVVHNLDIKGQSVTIGPFTTAGTYYIYCSIHEGMVLIIIVQ